MAKNEPTGDEPKNVQPDNAPADEPSKDQPKPDEGADKGAETPPKQDFTPDEDEPKGGEPDEGSDKTPAGEGGKPDGGEAGEGEDDDKPVPPESKHYYERQIKKRDDTIIKLTNALEENYVNQGSDDADKRIRAVEASNYVREVQQAQNDLVADNQRAQGEIDIFNPSKPEVYREEVYNRLKARYARDYLVTQQVKTADGQVEEVIIGYRVPFYEYLREEADLITGGGTATGATPPPATSTPPASTNEADRKMRGAADVPGGSSNRKEGEKDPFLVGLTEKPVRA